MGGEQLVEVALGLQPTARAAAAAASDLVADANGSVEYKRHLVGVIAERSLRAAIDEAASGASPE